MTIKKTYMQRPEYLLENKTHNILWDFEIKTDLLIQARRPGRVLVNKKKRVCQFIDFTVPVNQKYSKKQDKYWDLARKLKKVMEQEDDSDNNHSWTFS